MNKVIINACYGGFSLSYAATAWLADKGLQEAIENMAEMSKTYSCDFRGFRPRLPRHDALLVECVEALGEEANGDYANLVVVTIKGTQYRITEYDGAEDVETPESIAWVTV